MTCPLSPQQLHALAVDFIGQSWSGHLAQFQQAHPLPPADPAQALELGFVTGLLLGLDLLQQQNLTGATRGGREAATATAPALLRSLQRVASEVA